MKRADLLALGRLLREGLLRVLHALHAAREALLRLGHLGARLGLRLHSNEKVRGGVLSASGSYCTGKFDRVRFVLRRDATQEGGWVGDLRQDCRLLSQLVLRLCARLLCVPPPASARWGDAKWGGEGRGFCVLNRLILPGGFLHNDSLKTLNRYQFLRELLSTIL